MPLGDDVIQHRPKQQRGINHDKDSEVEIDTEHLQDSLLACLTKRHIYIPSVGNTSNTKNTLLDMGPGFFPACLLTTHFIL